VLFGERGDQGRQEWMMVTITQGFELSDPEPEAEIEVLVPLVRSIPGFGVIVGDGEKDEEKQAKCGPRWP
jgi:hypothetical protein